MDLKMRIGNNVVPIEWDNQSAKSMIMQKLSAHSKMQFSKKGGEQIGTLGVSVSRNDRSFIAKPGDIILRGGNQVSIVVTEDDVTATKLGHISSLSENQIKNMLAPSSLKIELFEG